jgi:hypothetical protein
MMWILSDNIQNEVYLFRTLAKGVQLHAKAIINFERKL